MAVAVSRSGHFLCLMGRRAFCGRFLPDTEHLLYIFIFLDVSSVSTVLAHRKTGFRFSMAEQVRDDSPGAPARFFIRARDFPAEVFRQGRRAGVAEACS